MNTTTPAFAVLLIVIASLVSGCTLMQPPTDTTVRPVDQLLFYSRALAEAAPSGRLAMLASARDAHAQNPTPATAARLALAYGQPGYKGYAPDHAARYAEQALAEGADYWGLAAAAFLRHVAALSAAQSKAHATNGDMQQEVAELRQALTDAQRKLEALTRVESELNQ